ncbi:MAG: sulfatase/phosphatase domain-containing protein, partial [Verrucomicrobiota bacterium]|nr:sulfatase/phosphatase domain-containing protein [Verrucomicrobiota bacterium]
EDWEMFDLTADPNELQSIYDRSEFAGIQSRLEKELKRLRAHYNVPEQDPENPRPNQRRKWQNNRKK